MSRRLIISSAIIFFGIFFCLPVLASNFYFENEPTGLQVGDEFELKVSVDAEDKTLNTIGGRIILPNDFFALKEILTGESGINFWVQTPSVNDSGELIFSGIVPGGFSGKLAIFSIILTAKKQGVATFAFGQPEAYIHDGLGTLDSVTSEGLSLNIFPRAEQTESKLIQVSDSQPPENFQPEIVDAEKTLGFKYALIFSTEDKQSGIAYFEIMERRRHELFGFEFGRGKYVTATSPYRLKDQNLKSDIFVKAVDKRGNVRIAELPASSPIFWYENRFVWGIIMLAALLLAVAFTLYGKFFKNKK